MDINSVTAVNLLTLLLGSSLLVALLNNSRKASFEHKKLVAEASKSVLRRQELYYRIRRRTKNPEDIITIRNLFHQIQEDNEYYKNLLISESKWHGERFVLYISAVQALTAQATQEAWSHKPFGPDVEIKIEEQPDRRLIDKLSLQFAKDTRRLMNPFIRPAMRIRDSYIVKKLWKITAYDIKKI